MTAHQIFILILIALALFVLPAFGLYFMFKKAGVPAWKGLVPVLNSYEMVRLSRRPVYSCCRLVSIAGDLRRICENIWQVQVLSTCPYCLYGGFIFFVCGSE